MSFPVLKLVDIQHVIIEKHTFMQVFIFQFSRSEHDIVSSHQLFYDAYCSVTKHGIIE